MPNCRHCGNYVATYTDDCPFSEPDHAKPCEEAKSRALWKLELAEDMRKVGLAHLITGTPEHYEYVKNGRQHPTPEDIIKALEKADAILFALQSTVDQDTFDKLEEARENIGQAILQPAQSLGVCPANGTKAIAEAKGDGLGNASNVPGPTAQVDVEALRASDFYQRLENGDPLPARRDGSYWNSDETNGWNRCLDYLASRSLIAQGWRPISEAPRDGTPFIGYSPTLGVRRDIMWSEQRQDFDLRGWSYLKRDWTHWQPQQPLPSPPDGGKG